MRLSASQSFSESYAAQAESVPAARSAVARFASDAGAVGERLDAIRLATSEAVTNAVVHAYAQPASPSEPGAVRLTLSCVEDELWILVGDEGGGIRPRRPSKGLGLGLALISELADDFQILSRGCGGTELRMRFKLRARGGGGGAQLRGSLSVAASPA
jgi:stage II sporulation protein AB (anti-sigma F factor)